MLNSCWSMQKMTGEGREGNAGCGRRTGQLHSNVARGQHCIFRSDEANSRGKSSKHLAPNLCQLCATCCHKSLQCPSSNNLCDVSPLFQMRGGYICRLASLGLLPLTFTLYGPLPLKAYTSLNRVLHPVSYSAHPISNVQHV